MYIIGEKLRFAYDLKTVNFAILLIDHSKTSDRQAAYLISKSI